MKASKAAKPALNASYVYPTHVTLGSVTDMRIPPEPSCKCILVLGWNSKKMNAEIENKAVLYL